MDDDGNITGFIGEIGTPDINNADFGRNAHKYNYSGVTVKSGASKDENTVRDGIWMSDDYQSKPDTLDKKCYSMKTRKIIIIVVGILLLFPIGGFVLSKKYNEYVKEQPKKYCYHTYFGPANSAFIITDLKYEKQYLKYHQIVESNGENISFNFPLKTLPQNDYVYILEYNNDSTLAKVVSYYDRGAYRGGRFLKGWVYSGTLHDISGNEFNDIREAGQD